MHPASRYFKFLYKQNLTIEDALETAKKNLIVRKDLTVDKFKQFYNDNLLEINDTDYSEMYESDSRYRLEVERAFQRNLTLKTAVSLMIMLKYTSGTIVSSLRSSGYEGIEERTVNIFKDMFFDIDLIESGLEAQEVIPTLEYSEYNEILQYAFFKPDIHFLTRLGVLPPVKTEQLVNAITSLAFSRLVEEIRNKNSSLSTNELLKMAFGAQELSARLKTMQSESFYDKVAILLKQVSIQTEESEDVSYNELGQGG